MIQDPIKITSDLIRAAMLKRYLPAEYAIMWEVAQATGAVRPRYADAIMMSLWPSRGLELHGVEIKVSRSDWRREAVDPKKAEAIGQYCDRWWVFTGPNVIQDVGELPPLWGWQEYNGKQWKVHKQAELRAEAAPMDRGFLAALLRRDDGRRRSEIAEAARRMVADAEGRIQQRVDDEVKRRTRDAREIEAQVRAFEEATGIALGEEHSWGWMKSDGKELGRAVMAVAKSGLLKNYGGLDDAANTLDRASARLRELHAELCPPEKSEAA